MIIDYNPKYAQDFKELNIEWLETFFYVEDYDNEVLSNPDTYILNKGGKIFFIMHDNKVAGTVALMKVTNSVFELTKMAVNTNLRGLKLGQKLMTHCLNEAKKMGLDKVILYSNTKLKNAIYIYKKFGFIEVPLEGGVAYKRANIKMEYIIS
jgi:N-acetylglutamate synthase-like GNAT family acetyltransferase